MLRVFVRKVCAYKLLKPRAAVCLPASVTEVEQRSAVEAVLSAGVRRVVVIEKAVAAAIGCGLDIAAPHGNMVVELGGGTTDVVVMSLKGISSVESIRVGGDDMDEAIIRHLRKPVRAGNRPTDRGAAEKNHRTGGSGRDPDRAGTRPGRPERPAAGTGSNQRRYPGGDCLSRSTRSSKRCSGCWKVRRRSWWGMC